MKLALVVINYNYSQYLEPCLKSIKHQTRQPDILIAVDDCSTDDSVEVLNKQDIVKFDAVLNNPYNAGVCFTRNAGLSKALELGATHMIYLDADDVLADPNYIMVLEATMAQTGADVIYTDCQLFGTSDEYIEYPEWDEGIFKVRNFVHVSALHKINPDIKWNEWMINGMEDYLYFIDYWSKGAKFAKAKNTGLHYRRHQNSSLTRDIQNDRISIAKKQIKILHPEVL